MGGWVNSDKMNFIDWLNTVYSKMERDTFSEQQLKFNDALSKKDLISNRLKPFFVKEHQHFVMDFLHKKSPYKGLLFYHGLGSGKTAASISTADGLHENGNKIIVMLPASLKTNYLEEIKVFGDALLRQKAYWCKVTLPSRNSTGYKALVDEIVSKGIPKKILLQQGFAWLIDEEKTKNGEQNNPEEIKEIERQVRYLIRLKYNFVHYNSSNLITSLFDYTKLLKYRPEKNRGDLNELYKNL